MTTVGWVGLGKLGLPCALALERYGSNDVVGFDPDPRVAAILAGEVQPRNDEEGMADLLRDTHLKLQPSVADVVALADDVVFVSVQTPHGAEYGGEQPMPERTANFDYTHLVHAVDTICVAALDRDRPLTIAVVSTVLPGTMREHLLANLPENVSLMYNPFFIAMGTTVHDFLHPEFVLLGSEPGTNLEPMVDLYADLLGGEVPVRLVSIETAELTKVAYNTFISLKIVFANTLMEICTVTGADVDDVVNTLGAANRRIISPAYLRGGMGDGGACHPRDNIAMSWLAQAARLSADPFEFVTRAREAQSGWLATFVTGWARSRDLPVVLLGKSYKPNSDLVYGSPALLLAHQLRQRGIEFTHLDHHVDENDILDADAPALYVICTKHPEYARYPFAAGSVVIDPHRYVQPQDDVKLVALGRGWRD
jgi:UDPglucose 6-dehydrogenase